VHIGIFVTSPEGIYFTTEATENTEEETFSLSVFSAFSVPSVVHRKSAPREPSGR
jgi:hypothetical protein